MPTYAITTSPSAFANVRGMHADRKAEDSENNKTVERGHCRRPGVPIIGYEAMDVSARNGFVKGKLHRCKRHINLKKAKEAIGIFWDALLLDVDRGEYEGELEN